MCAYLDHLIKFLQLPYGIIWIQLTSHSVPRILCASYRILHLIYTLPLLSLASRNFKTQKNGALQLVYSEYCFKPMQLDSRDCGLSQYTILPSFRDNALLKTSEGWSYSSLPGDFCQVNSEAWKCSYIIWSTNMKAQLHQSFGYTRILFHSPCTGFSFKILDQS